MNTTPSRPACILSIAIVTACLLGATPMAARADADPWRVDFTTWLWLYGITGDIGIGPLTADVDSTFLDVLQESDSVMAFSGRLEVGYGKFAGYVDGTYAKVGADDQSGSAGAANIDVTVNTGLVDFGLMYRLTDWESTVDERGGALDIYAGARYLTLGVELDPAAANSLQRDRDWIDPIVGLKVRQPLAPAWHLSAWGDVGGFGVSSDLTWSVTAVVGFDFELFKIPATFYVGYRAIGWDYTDGSGPSRLEWDAVMHGPTLGFQARF